MPLYFFDTYDGESFMSDDTGVELETPEVARAEAQKFLPEMARESLPDGNHRTFAVSVRSEAGQVLVRMSLSLVVEEGDVDHQPVSRY
jgi:hypothetical protein